MHCKSQKFLSRPVYCLPLLLLTLFSIRCDNSTNGGFPPYVNPYAEDWAYYPLAIGNQWEYSIGDTTFWTYTIVDTSHSLRGDSSYMRITGHGEDMPFYIFWDLNFLYFSADTIDSYKTARLKLPIQLYSEWKAFDNSGTAISNFADAEIISMDSIVTVQAGTFETVVVEEITYTIGDHGDTLATPDTVWTAFAKDVGVIFFRFSNGIDYNLNTYTVGP